MVVSLGLARVPLGTISFPSFGITLQLATISRWPWLLGAGLPKRLSVCQGTWEGGVKASVSKVGEGYEKSKPWGTEGREKASCSLSYTVPT